MSKTKRKELISEIRGLSKKDLPLELEKAKREKLQIKSALTTGKEKNSHKLHSAKLRVAHLQTTLNEIKREEANKTQTAKSKDA